MSHVSFSDRNFQQLCWGPRAERKLAERMLQTLPNKKKRKNNDLSIKKRGLCPKEQKFFCCRVSSYLSRFLGSLIQREKDHCTLRWTVYRVKVPFIYVPCISGFGNDVDLIYYCLFCLCRFAYVIKKSQGVKEYSRGFSSKISNKYQPCIFRDSGTFLLRFFPSDFLKSPLSISFSVCWLDCPFRMFKMCWSLSEDVPANYETFSSLFLFHSWTPTIFAVFFNSGINELFPSETKKKQTKLFAMAQEQFSVAAKEWLDFLLPNFLLILCSFLCADVACLPKISSLQHF